MQIAVIIPCLNEEKTIKKVVQDFHRVLSSIEEKEIKYSIYVYDNNSIDNTVEEAKSAGAIVKIEKRKGKANVIRKAFRDINADYYIIVDGDDTYDAEAVKEIVKIIKSQHPDIINCIREEITEAAYRKGHKIGNKILNKAVQIIFKNEFKDMLSGYKAMSKKFVKSFPVLSEGFDLEAEIAIHALELKCDIKYIKTRYKERPHGSKSKLKTYKDGFKILKLILNLFRHEKPLTFYGIISIILAIISVSLGIPVVKEFIETGKVPRFPTAILASAIGIISVVFMAIGLINDTVTKGRKELKMIAFNIFEGGK
ncbi:MAG: glycosyltransferase family 2 protein [Candidatus Aenigmatarchaeota archaeon]